MTGRPQQPDTRGTNPTMALATTPILELNNGNEREVGEGIRRSGNRETAPLVVDNS
jgi:hypothetical protein